MLKSYCHHQYLLIVRVQINPKQYVEESFPITHIFAMGVGDAVVLCCSKISEFVYQQP